MNERKSMHDKVVQMKIISIERINKSQERLKTSAQQLRESSQKFKSLIIKNNKLVMKKQLEKIEKIKDNKFRASKSSMTLNRDRFNTISFDYSQMVRTH